MFTEREQLLLAHFVERYRHSEAGRLVKGVVHNMNNLLHTMSMQVELLRRRLVNLASIQDADRFAEEKDRCLTKIDEVAGELARLNDMIGTLVSKGIHDDSQTPGPVDLNALLAEELAVRYADMFYKHKVEKKIELAQDLPAVHGFHVDFAQALGAIIENSLEAMESSDRRELAIATAQENGSVVVSIADTGCGLPEGGGERAFEPFYTTKAESGSHAGLGLYLARQLLGPYGGKVDLSGGPGGGAVARISVPVGKPAAD